MIKDLVSDSMIICGAGLISWGAYLVGEQYGYIVSGLFLFGIGVGLARVKII